MSNAALAEEPKTKKPEPVTLRSLHDYSLTTNALEHRVEELKKLAKKNTDEGYVREARAIEADAASIEHQILPCFRNQRELPLVSEAQLEKEVAGALRRIVFSAFEGLGDPKVLTTPEMIAHRRDHALKRIAERVTAYTVEVAEDAFNQGAASRQQTSESIALRSVTTLRPIDS